MENSKEIAEKRKQLIKDHLDDWEGLAKSSIEDYADSGKVSGTLLTEIERLLQAHTNTMLEELKEEVENLEDGGRDVYGQIHDVVKRDKILARINQLQGK